MILKITPAIVGGLMSALESGSSGPGSSYDQETVLCSWADTLTVITLLSTWMCKWVLVNLMLQENPTTVKHAIHAGGSRNTPCRFAMGHLARKQT